VKWGRGASAGAGRAQKGAGVRGQATWSRISACVRAGPWQFVGKAELTGQSMSQREGAGARRGMIHRANRMGPQGKGGKGRAGFL
jgi:hypothetical protein